MSIAKFFLILLTQTYCLIWPMPSQKTNSLSPITITSHRGFSGKYPENTLLAIQKALELGVDRIEIDVHQTKDSVLVLMHDKTIDRTTNGKGTIKALNYKELQVFSAGVKFDSLFLEEKVPTLAEILKMVQGKAQLIIEIKEGHAYYPNIEQRIIETIAKAKAKDWCIIHSFKDEVLDKVHELDSTIVVHKLLFSPLFYDFTKPTYLAEFSVYHRSITVGLVKKIHKMDKKLNAWTVNEAAKMQKLKALGVDGIITDFPDVAMELK